LRWTDAKGAHEELITATKLVESAPGADVRVADRGVSRIHCELEPTDRGAWIRELGSLNGTIVNGLRVTGAIVAERAVLELGTTELQLSYDTEPVAVELWAEVTFFGLLGTTTVMRELFAARVDPE
jgi:pSer/pThr/pTyr-binding forkhead associated (FHA) protein